MPYNEYIQTRIPLALSIMPVSVTYSSVILIQTNNLCHIAHKQYKRLAPRLAQIQLIVFRVDDEQVSFNEASKTIDQSILFAAHIVSSDALPNVMGVIGVQNRYIEKKGGTVPFCI